MTNAFSQLIQDTLKFIKDLPEEMFELCTQEDAAYFPQQKGARPMHQPTPRSTPISSPPQIQKPSPIKATPAAPISPQASPPPEAHKPQNPTAALPSTIEIRTTLHTIAPHLKLTDKPPSDQIAQRVASAWQEKIPGIDVILLLLDNTPESVDFAKNLGKAVHTQLAPAKVISATRLEQEKKWDLFLEKNTFRLIIATDGMHNYPHLQSQYTALPSQALEFLGKVPLVTLAPVASYTHSPEQKMLLWKRLCQILAT